MIRRNRRWLGGLMFAVVFPSTAQAQIVVRSFDELQRILKVDETVVITDESGRQTRGKVADVSAASLTVVTPEKRTFLERSVAQIRRTDSPPAAGASHEVTKPPGPPRSRNLRLDRRSLSTLDRTPRLRCLHQSARRSTGGGGFSMRPSICDPQNGHA